jgi:DNA polymerase-3 subunit beta
MSKQPCTVTTAEAFVAALRPSIRTRKSTIPILEYALLSGDTITSTDLDRHVITKLACSETSEEPTLFPIIRAMQVLAGEAGELTITTKDKKVTFAVNGCRYTFDVLNPANFPTIPTIPAPTLTLQAADLKTLINRTLFAVSSEKSRYTLNGALFDLKDGKLKMVATDGHRLAMATLPTAPEGSLRMLITRGSLGWLRAHCVDQVGISTGELWQFFVSGPNTLASRALTGQFPDYEAVIPLKDCTRKAVFTASPARRLRSVAFCADPRTGSCTWKFSKDGSSVSAKSMECGEASAPIVCEFEGDPIRIAWNADYVRKSLRIAGDQFTIEMKDETSASTFLTDNFLYLAMPMRI